jgi:hypothetical protein
MPRSPDDSLPTIACPSCRFALQPRVRHAGKRVRCPQCKATVQVPALPSEEEEVEPATKQWPDELLRPDIPPGAEAFEIEPLPAATLPQLPIAYHQAKARLEADLAAAPKPPRWTFFSGVYTFPFHPDVALRWGILAAALFGCGLLLWLALTFGPVALVLFGVSALIASVWVFSYVATTLLSIVEQTAAGNDEMEWRDDAMSERLVPAASVGLLAGLAAGAGYLAAWPLVHVGGAVTHYAAAGVIGFLLFPVLLLSAMDRGSAVLPWSTDVLTSLGKRAGAWAAFYALGGLVSLAAVATGLVLPAVAPFTAVIVAPGVLAAAVLVYARLLGRLGWRISP